jgi:5-(carboxyamino)imidazole ribonucleotide synthase
MIGAGQLARMTYQAAIDYGIDFLVLAQSRHDPAASAGAPALIGSPHDYSDLERAAKRGGVITFDHELVPRAHIIALEEAGHRLHPGSRALLMSQDKLALRQSLPTLTEGSVPMPGFGAARDVAGVERFAEEYGWPVVLKARGGGYDGRGVHVATTPAEVANILRTAGEAREACFVVEEHLDLAQEFVVLSARSPSGAVAQYPCIATYQQEGMLRELTMPALLDPGIEAEATELARAIVAGIGATGVCAVEFFLTGDKRLLVNELALRPHNSGHATIEAAATSQFHQHLRAILDWPLGSTALHSPAATVNIIGQQNGVDPRSRIRQGLQVPGAQIHLYDKDVRLERKLGHVTALGHSVPEALATARRAVEALLSE